MMDLRDGFEQIAGRPLAPNSAELMADLDRGRRALRKRRTAQVAGGSLFAVAAAVAAISLSGTVSLPGNGATTATGDRPPAASSAAGSLKLVAYKGKQPHGFTIDTVPDGFFIQGDNDYDLVLAPNKPKLEPGPAASNFKDPSHFAGKILITLESKDQNGPGRDGTKVTVGDKDGLLVQSLGAQIPGQPDQPPAADDMTLWVEQADGRWLLIQYAPGLGLSQDQMVEIGAGVHVHKDAKQGVG